MQSIVREDMCVVYIAVQVAICAIYFSFVRLFTDELHVCNDYTLPSYLSVVVMSTTCLQLMGSHLLPPFVVFCQ